MEWTYVNGVSEYTYAYTTFLYRLQEPILELLYGAINGVHAFGYNSAESEPIWMISGAH